MKNNPALQALENRSADASRSAQERRDRPEKRTPIDMASYREGEAIAFSDAHKIVTTELRRLRAAYQGGYLTLSDFGVW
jgi:hypothetical protein